MDAFSSLRDLISGYSKFELFLFFVAIVTIFYLLINFFTSFGEHAKPPRMSVPFTLDTRDQFLETLAYAVHSNVDEGTSIETLTNGSEFLPDFLKEIDNARNYIYVTDYLWEDDAFGNTVFETLTKKAQEGLRVRVLLDGVGGHTVSKETIQKLTDAGGEVAYFRPLKWWNINRWDRRNHMRDIVIDGRVGYLGGIAFTEAWMGSATTSKSWHDYMFKVDGTFARRLESVFNNVWSQTTGEILPVPAVAAAPNNSNIHFVSLFSTPSPDTSSNMDHFIWLSIMAAQKSIYIENPYILPSDAIKEALIEKAKAGVDVRIIGPDGTDAKHVKWASQSYYTELLGAGIKIYEYQPSRIHAKTMVIDGTWSIIGSANLDNRSSRINLELIAGTDDPNLAKTLDEKFTIDMGKSKEMTAEIWKTHSILLTPIRWISRMFVWQY